MVRFLLLAMIVSAVARVIKTHAVHYPSNYNTVVVVSSYPVYSHEHHACI